MKLLKLLLPIVLLLAACGTRAPVRYAASDTATARTAASADTTPPPARPGTLVARSVQEDGAPGGSWRLRAGVCTDPPSFQLLAQSDSTDLLMVLHLPRDTAAVGTYVVAGPTDTTLRARTARMGIQEVRYADISYQATSGTVQLDRLDRVAAGRFDVMLHGMPTHQTTRYLGVFDAIPVDTLGAAACRVATPDTARTPIRRKPT